MSKLNVAIIFGGNSSEHNVSEISAESIVKNISREKYNIYLIGINKKGEWFLFKGDTNEISRCRWEECIQNKKIHFSPDPSIRGIIVKNEDGNCNIVKLDVVIPVLHGKNGEDGTIQGLFELAKIPYVGCGVMASAACMDKIITNSTLSYHGINKPAFHWFSKYDFENFKDKCIEKTEEIINTYPMFVKPANAGSSVGISKVKDREELIEGIKKALKEDERVLIEKAVVGRELECAVLGNNELLVSSIGEIIPSNEFYDYEAKYLNMSSKTRIADDLSPSTVREIQNVAVQAYKIMGCKGLSRVDFFLESGTDKVILNEINTFPGFTSISMYPKLMHEKGIEFSHLLDRLINLALDNKLN